MKPKFVFKIIIDIVMSIIMLFIMAFQVTGQQAHEWLGMAMFILFFIHNFLNIKWYKNIFKGKYKAIRIFQTVVNTSLILTMICTMFSGIVMSEYSFAFLNIDGNLAIARKVHMASTYWCFLFMSIHIGLHWGMVVSMTKRLNINALILKILSAIIALYGAYSFFSNKIFNYMFLINEFAFFDYEKSSVVVIIQYLAMMGLWIFIAYYGTRYIIKNKTPMVE